MSRERTRQRFRERKRVVIVILVGGLLGISFLGALIIPLYSYPGVDWNKIIAAKEANPGVGMVAIINPDNGPGAGIDQNYVTGVNNLRAAGVVVLGYDHTSYGARPLATVEADVNSYKSWYNVSGIFFDEMSNVHGYESYYSTLNAYAKAAGLPFTVGNPGSSFPASFIGTLDVIVTYENLGVPTSASLQSMTNGLPKNNFAVIAYGVNTFNATAVANIFNYASYVYVTNNTVPNPYGALSGDFNKMVSILAKPTSPPPTTVALTVQSANLAGTPIIGLWSSIASTNGTAIASGYTPLVHSVPTNANYVVSVSNYGNDVFAHWATGGTNPTSTMTVTQATTVTADYSTATAEALTVQSASSTGSAISGITATISANGKAVASGLTPLTYVGVQGTSYSVTMPSPTGGYTFGHWNDGTTTLSKTLTLNAPTTLTATYTTPSSQITVQAVTSSGTPITGLWTTIKSTSGQIVSSGYTPLTFTGTLGAQYTITASNFLSYVFNHWNDGTTAISKTLTLTASTTLTATYTTTSQVTIQSVTLNGAPLTGLYTVVQSSTGAVVASGYTPLTFSATNGVTYTIITSNYGTHNFNHWDSGSTNSVRAITVNGATTFTAYYS